MEALRRGVTSSTPLASSFNAAPPPAVNAWPLPSGAPGNAPTHNPAPVPTPSDNAPILDLLTKQMAILMAIVEHIQKPAPLEELVNLMKVQTQTLLDVQAQNKETLNSIRGLTEALARSSHFVLSPSPKRKMRPTSRPLEKAATIEEGSDDSQESSATPTPETRGSTRVKSKGKNRGKN